MPRSDQDMLDTFKSLLKGRTFERTSPVFNEAVEWTSKFPSKLPETERLQIRAIICEAFRMSEAELDAELSLRRNGETRVATAVVEIDEEELLGILPGRGILRRYVEYTLHSEAPLAYHVFSALCGIGSILNRRVYLNMGYYRLFPTLGIIILGPSGVKKTSAANITIDLLQHLSLVKIYSEKITPEALIDAMKGENATGLLYAPEMTVFLNKQKYNEGLVQLITRFMDCPDLWENSTIGRGKNVLHNVAISSLMCSTLDWFVRSTPQDSFGGGFIARNLLIVQESSPRSEPIPEPGNADDRERLVCDMACLHEMQGEVTLDDAARENYVDWYNTEHKKEALAPEHEILASYYNRKPDHLKRLAISLHLSACGSMAICGDCFGRALALINWTEKFLPSMLQQMFRSAVGEDQELVLRAVRNAGTIEHGKLIRKMGYKLDAQATRRIVASLKEQGWVEEVNNSLMGHVYRVKEA